MSNRISQKGNRRSGTVAQRAQRDHYAPTLNEVGHKGAHKAACGAPVDDYYPRITSHEAFVTCQRCLAIMAKNA